MLPPLSSDWEELDLDDTSQGEYSSDEDNEESNSDTQAKEKFLIINVYIDTEYTDDYNLSIQVIITLSIDDLVLRKVYFLIDKSYKDYITEDIQSKHREVVFMFEDLISNKTTNYLQDLIYLFLKEFSIDDMNYNLIKVYVWFYFSLKDLNFAFGPELMRKQYLLSQPTIKQYRSVFGFLSFTDKKYKFILKDLFGLEKYGLLQLVTSYGLDPGDKNILDDYKKNMEQAIFEKPSSFVAYSLNDVYVLEKLPGTIVSCYNVAVMKNSFNLPESEFFTIYDIPLTVGSLVYVILTKFLKHSFFGDDPAKQLAFCKMGILNQQAKNYSSNKEAFDLLKSIKTYNSLKKVLSEDKAEAKILLSLLKKKVFKYTALQYASSKYLIDYTGGSQLFKLSSVSGGRTVNEQPWAFFFSLAVDLDIAGAYAVVLSLLPLCFGRPHYFYTSPNSPKVTTLKKFLDSHRDNIMDLGLFKIVVSGNLDFFQDLIYSRIYTDQKAENIQVNFDPTDPDSFDGSAPLVLLRKEISNGTITKSILELIEKVSTTKELSQFYQLEVQSAIYWSKEDQVEDIETYCKILMADSGEYAFNKKHEVNVDTRTHKWIAFPLGKAVNKLRELRSNYKKLGTSQGNAFQNTIKTFLNTMYGVLCSVYFPINNVVLGDFITSTIRSNCWLMAKSLNSYLSVTDGVPFSLDKVYFLKSVLRKPGFNTFSSTLEMQKHKSLYLGSLGCLDWEEKFKEKDFSKINSLSLQHIKSFWGHYNINFLFDVEYKTIIAKGSYFAKAHYIFQAYNPKENDFTYILEKIRGFNKKADVEYLNPIYSFMLFLMENPQPPNDKFIIPNNGSYQITSLLRIRSWKLSLEKTAGQSKSVFSIYGVYVLPGDAVVLTREFRLNNSHFFLNEVSDYKQRIKRGYRTTKVNGGEIKMPLFEKYLPTLGVNKTFLLMMENDLRSKAKK